VAAFETNASSYDRIRYPQLAAKHLVELCPPPLGSRVLDVATGSGWAAIAAARQVGPGGSVLGVDLASSLLEQARQKATESGLDNLEFRVADAQHLDFPDGSFDIVLCASALFYFPDMLAAVRGWYWVLVPGGWAAFCWWGPTLRQPLINLWRARLQKFGIEVPVSPNQSLKQPETCRQLLEQAGFLEVQVQSVQLGYYFGTTDEYWSDIMAGGFSAPISAAGTSSR
jgi:SAM-dependent methyltransferase